MRLGNSSENYLNAAIHSDEDLQSSIEIIESILFLAFQ
jgi:hypothetical protein